ncbi:malto-oligosyltrehalose synthase [Hoyosella sp. YIM 151337]|uniref:malto-oligosyltrehalose synthase n=1 Tax=Hoyosella sp. YIM 151337 TaxID=2992742 RepID=UPI00223669CF|nr:malto-oligosyltrehalose synthase [Hoyosella sp. YIM 151337]MCW4355435.1 malto-oligosyltrehalose synthase [Hoyosella sp. YIM 151337]
MITATYRLQLRQPTAESAGFTFADAAGLIPYFRELGVSHLYLSPFLTAVDGTTHGYDVVDPTSVAHELGGIEGLTFLAAEARQSGIGLIGDIVPNHMGVGKPRNNKWWWDVLAHGRASRHAQYFDIDWDADPEGRLRLPVLGSSAELSELSVDGDVLRMHGIDYPIAPGTHHGPDLSAQQIHSRQHYRLIDWRDGPNFRRFLGINELAALRQEEDRVFAATHQLIGELAAEGILEGVRVDHLDGLADPVTYVRKLRELLGADRYLVVEKVIGRNEELPPDLPVDGTTGYEVLREIGALFIPAAGTEPLAQLAQEFTGKSWRPHDVATEIRALKIAALEGPLAPELTRLARAVAHGTDAGAIRTAITGTIAELAVYRADSPDHAHHLDGALEAAGRENSAAAHALAQGLRSPAVLARFSQLSAGAMSIATEGPLAYRAALLVSALEMGGDATRLSATPGDVHAFLQRTAEMWPRTMTTLSTHDAKRGEDVRARISAIAQRPEQFAELARELDAVEPAPDRATGYLLLQSLVGVWPQTGPPSPALRERFASYAVKAVREAGLQSSWAEPNIGFERSLRHWTDAVFDGSSAALISAFVAEIAPCAHAVSLGQKLFQLAGPGIPDVYQGTEMWEDSLTDPDNRRFISFPRFALTLREINRHPPSAAEPINWTKLRLVKETLALRQERPGAFTGGTYLPLTSDGECVTGFARAQDARKADVCALTTRFTASHADTWQRESVELPAGTWRDRLTGNQHSGTALAGDLFRIYPVALLARI